MSNLLAFIDGKQVPADYFKPLVSSRTKNTYWSTPGAQYGLKVTAESLPNGTNTEIRVGTSVKDSVVIPLAVEPGKPGFRGKQNIKVNETSMVAEGYINALDGGEFTLRIVVHRPSGGGGKRKAVTL